MVNSVTTSMTCGMYFIPLSTQLSIVKWTLMFLMKSSINQLFLGLHFRRKNSRSPQQTITMLQPLVQISCQQSHLKIILKDDECLNSIIRIANIYIELGYWPLHFKKSTIVVIPKPNKKLYDTHKSFRPIVLLNTISKLIKKVIRERLQFIMAAKLHPLESTRWIKAQIYNRCGYSTYTHYSNGLSQELDNKYPCFLYCTVFPIAQPLSPHPHYEESKIQQSYYFILFQLSCGQKN